ncbi:unnamed protein product [Ophioblennius macclurei]
MYVQRGNDFVNGFHQKKELPKGWPNTWVENNRVHMYNLNVSHEGDYKCHFPSGTILLYSLRITAPYSKPSLTRNCDADGAQCRVACRSDGGYPRKCAEWKVGEGKSNSSLWLSGVRNDSEVPNPDTLLFDVYADEVINCAAGETTISCSVGDSASEAISVCVAPAGSYPWWIYAVLVGVVLPVLGLVCFCCRRCRKKGQSRTSAGNSLQRVPTNENERISLQGKTDT